MKEARWKEATDTVDGGGQNNRSNQERKGTGRRRSEAVKQTLSKQKGKRSSQVTGHSEERDREERRKGGGGVGVPEAPWLQSHSFQ